MSNFFPQEPLFTGGTGSNDPIVPNVSNPGANLGASGQVRQEAAATVAASTQSPEAQDEALARLQEEIDENKKIIAQAEAKIRKQELYTKAIERSEAAIKSLREKNEKDLRLLAKEAGAWDSKKGLVIIGDDGKQHFMMPDEYKRALDDANDIRHDTAVKFEKQLQARLTRKDLGLGAPGTMSGTRGEQFTDRPGFHIGDLIGAAASGNFSGLIKELIQPFGKGEWQKALQERGAMMTTRGAEMGGLRGLARGAGGRLMALAPMLATPAALLGAQQFVSRVTRQTQDTIREGQVTGGGFGEGLAARREGLALALNPFDMMDRRTAQQVVSGIRGRGFTGELGRALQDTVGDVFQDLGTDIEETMDMVTDVVKGNIMTIDEFRDTMRDLDDQAKKTGLSVKAVQGNLKSIMDLAGAAGGPQASALAADASEPLQEIFKNLKATRSGQLGTITQPFLQQAALAAGVPAFMAGGPEVQRQQAIFFDQFTDYLFNMMQRMPPPLNTENGLAMFLVAQNPQLIGGITDVTEATLFLQDLFKAKRSGGFQKAFLKHAQEQVAQESRNALEGGHRLSRKGWRKFVPGIGAIVDKISGTPGTVSTHGIRQSLQEIHEGLMAVGTPEEKISEILRPGREIAFNAKLSPEDRSDRFKEVYDRMVEQAQREIKVTLDMRPEASRYFYGVNQPNQAYVAGGKGSQYTIPAPPIRGG